MNNRSLRSRLARNLVACVLLANPAFTSAVAQEKAEDVANKAIKGGSEGSKASALAEEALRQQYELEADLKIMDGDKAYIAGDYNTAIESYEGAITSYDKSTESEKRVIDKIAKAKKRLAMFQKEHGMNLYSDAIKNLSVEEFEKAEKLLREAAVNNPELDKFVSDTLAELVVKKRAAEYHGRVDAAASADFAAKREQDKQWRKDQAQILYSNRRFKDAKEILEEVLVVDPFDQEAATLLRRVNNKLFASGTSRRKATVQERIDEVEWKWSLPINSSLEQGPQAAIDAEGKVPKSDEFQEISDLLKLNIPSFRMKDQLIVDVIEKVRELSRDVDPDRKGLNIIYRPFEEGEAAGGAIDAPAGDPLGGAEEDPFAEGFGEDAAADPFAEPEAGGGLDGGGDAVADGAAGKRYSFHLEGAPVGEIIRYVCISSGLKYKIESDAVIIADPRVKIHDMVTRFYPVTSQVFAQLADNAAAGGGDAGAGLFDAGVRDTGAEESAKSYLESMGVQFDAGADAQYLQGVSRLVVTNTITEQRRVQEILNQLQTGAAQVIIESKFVEINQRNLEEFGFQWLLMRTSNNLSEDGLHIQSNNPDTDVTYSATENQRLDGLRSGIRSITSLVPGMTGSTESLGQLQFTSVLGANQFNTIVRAISQQDNSDVLSAPKVITQNGNTAILKVVEERYFPESWEAPNVEQFAAGGGGGGNNGGGNNTSVSPSLPNFGDPRDIGVVLEVTPQVDPDGYVIELELKPQVVELIGFETRFNTPFYATSLGGNIVETVARFDMPILSTRDITTRVKIWDGETVVLGGLIKEKVISVSDKVPYLSKMPVFGRLFENKGEHHVKQNLLIFVTARLVNNAGLPVRESDIRGLPDFKRL